MVWAAVSYKVVSRPPEEVPFEQRRRDVSGIGLAERTARAKARRQECACRKGGGSEAGVE